jgi:hypothetical protein
MKHSLLQHKEIIDNAIMNTLPKGTINTQLVNCEDSWLNYLATYDGSDFEFFFVVDRETSHIWYYYDNGSDCPQVVKQSIVNIFTVVEMSPVGDVDAQEEIESIIQVLDSGDVSEADGERYLSTLKSFFDHIEHSEKFT